MTRIVTDELRDAIDNHSVRVEKKGAAFWIEDEYGEMIRLGAPSPVDMLPGDIVTFGAGHGEISERRWTIIDTPPNRPKLLHHGDMRRVADEAKQRRRAGNRAARAARKRNRK